MALTLFKCGTAPVAAGQLEQEITGLDLPFDPAVFQASLRAPSADSPRIQAFVVGEANRRSVNVMFSSEPEDGYLLDWTAWAVSVTPEEGDTLAVTYTDLFRKVKRFLGYGASTDPVTEAQREEIDDAIQSGVRQFYYPPIVEGADTNYEWSFLRSAAEVTTSPGVASVMLPDGFGRLCGDLQFASGDPLPPVLSVPEGLVAGRNSAHPETGTPRVAAVRWRGSFGTHGQQSEMLFWPIPDKQYTFSFVYEADTGRLDEENRPYPLGGARFSELVTESCLAVAEQRSNDEMGLHTRKFQELLLAAIEQDRKFTASTYGRLSSELPWKPYCDTPYRHFHSPWEALGW